MIQSFAAGLSGFLGEETDAPNADQPVLSQTQFLLAHNMEFVLTSRWRVNDLAPRRDQKSR
jgi:hypothetical protein